jgi:ABC-type Fe3+/spermidine/putrescine transport system ATPase subunit
MKSQKPVLEARSLTKQYGSKVVLADVSVSLGKGEWLAVLGESGSGKSTLLKILGRFIDPDSGSVLFNNKILSSATSELIPGHDQIKLIHQEFELFPNQSVEENIGYALRFYERDFREMKVRELLEITGLGYVRSQKAKLLSGGEKQRTAIAKALAEQPEILLLDEPFAHLDNHNRHVLADAIELMKRQQKMACIFVTHEASEALAWSDRLAVLRDGRIIQAGTPQEVYENPVNAYVAELTGDINWIDEQKTAYIRPEKLRRTMNPEKSRWKGKVDNVRFHGNYWEIRCVNSRESLSFYRYRKDVSVGEEVMLTYARKDLKAI